MQGGALIGLKQRFLRAPSSTVHKSSESESAFLLLARGLLVSQRYDSTEAPASDNNSEVPLILSNTLLLAYERLSCRGETPVEAETCVLSLCSLAGA